MLSQTIADRGSPAIMQQLISLRNSFVKNRSIWVPGDAMRDLLVGLGATDKDFDKLEQACSNLPADPSLPFRRTRNGRFLMDMTTPQQPTLRRIKQEPFLLTAKEDWVRFDGGVARLFPGITSEMQSNTAVQALFAFKAFMLKGNGEHWFAKRPDLDYNNPNFVSWMFQIRTTTTPEILGEPALEGVHSDGVDATMTTYINGSNVSEHSAETFVHDNRQKNALTHSASDPQYRVGRYQHKNFLDTLLFLDHERKHSLSPVEAVDKSQDATRDMLVFATRKPALQGHTSFHIDSLEEHEKTPLCVKLGPVPPRPARLTGGFVGMEMRGEPFRERARL